jgi:hypothetical protein
MPTDKRRGVSRKGSIKKGYKVSKSGPQSSGHGAVPITIVKTPTVVKLKPMGMTYGGESAGKGSTRRVKRQKAGGGL